MEYRKEQNSKQILVQDIEKFEKLFNGLDNVLEQLKKTIGYTDVGTKTELVYGADHVEILKKTEKGIVTEAPFEIEVVDPHQKTTSEKSIEFRGSIPYYLDNMHVAGLNQHKVNPYIFIAESTEFSVEPHLDVSQQRKERTTKILDRVTNRTSSNKISLVVFGNQNKSQNFFYNVTTYPVDETATIVYQINDQNKLDFKHKPFNGMMQKFKLGGPDAKQSIQIYYIHTTKETLNLSSRDLNFLYGVYCGDQIIVEGSENAEAEEYSKAPTIFFDEKGLDSAVMMAFAFEITRNFKRIFGNTNTQVTTDNLKNVYDLVRESRSPCALTSVSDLTNALYLAFGLEIVELELQCDEQIRKFIETQKNFESQKIKITAILNTLPYKLTYTDKHQYLETELNKPENSILKVKPLISFFGNYGAYDFLEALKACYELRIKIDTKLKGVFGYVENLNFDSVVNPSKQEKKDPDNGQHVQRNKVF